MKYSILLTVFVATFADGIQAADYRLPFDDQWFVGAGGDTRNVNHHMRVASQWYGVDFVKTGGLGNRSIAKPNAKALNDYLSWGQRVLSPAAGVVRKVLNDQPDNPVGVQNRKNPFGNYVVIEAGPKEFVYLAHFQKESIVVKEGQRVIAGQPLGKCGNSGNTSSPHIHMHVQDQLKPFAGRGQNITFKGINVLLSHKQFVNVDWPLIQGLFVRQGKGLPQAPVPNGETAAAENKE